MVPGLQVSHSSPSTFSLHIHEDSSQVSKLRDPAALQGQGSQVGWLRNPAAHLNPLMLILSTSLLLGCIKLFCF